MTKEEEEEGGGGGGGAWRLIGTLVLPQRGRDGRAPCAIELAVDRNLGSSVPVSLNRAQ